MFCYTHEIFFVINMHFDYINACVILFKLKSLLKFYMKIRIYRVAHIRRTHAAFSIVFAKILAGIAAYFFTNVVLNVLQEEVRRRQIGRTTCVRWNAVLLKPELSHTLSTNNWHHKIGHHGRKTAQ